MSLNTELDNAIKALRIAVLELTKATVRMKEENDKLRKPKLEIVATACAEHGQFPCRKCGTKHYDGCRCGFCR